MLRNYIFIHRQCDWNIAWLTAVNVLWQSPGMSTCSAWTVPLQLPFVVCLLSAAGKWVWIRFIYHQVSLSGSVLRWSLCDSLTLCAEVLVMFTLLHAALQSNTSLNCTFSLQCTTIIIIVLHLLNCTPSMYCCTTIEQFFDVYSQSVSFPWPKQQWTISLNRDKYQY